MKKASATALSGSVRTSPSFGCRHLKEAIRDCPALACRHLEEGFGIYPSLKYTNPLSSMYRHLEDVLSRLKNGGPGDRDGDYDYIELIRPEKLRYNRRSIASGRLCLHGVHQQREKLHYNRLGVMKSLNRVTMGTNKFKGSLAPAVTKGILIGYWFTSA